MKLIHSLAVMAVMSVGIMTATAQKAPIKWGDIPQEHLEMRSFAADSNSAAVILADYGTVEFNPDFGFEFKRHRRIKILSEAGYSWGTHSVPYYAFERMQKVRDVRGQTFVLNSDGKVTRQALGKDAIFDENVDGKTRRMRFTLPALQPGAVIEYSYVFSSNNPVLLPEWTFQTSEPTLWSEYRVVVPERLSYVRATRGISSFHIEESTKKHTNTGEDMQYRYVMKDVAALREEPYMTTPQDYRARVEFQLHSYYVPDRGVETIVKTWDALAGELMESNEFGKRLDRPRKDLRAQVQLLTSGVDDPAEKMRLIYDYVRSNISWTGYDGYWLDQEIEDVYRSRKGSTPEIALLLISMLREAGIDADPVLISTRSHGAVVQQYPLLRQFDSVLAHATIGSQTYLLDATDPLRPLNLLPYESLNGKGWLVQKRGATWIDVERKGKSTRHAFVTGVLKDDGTFEGTLKFLDSEYSALLRRKALRETKEDEWVRTKLLKEIEDVEVRSHSITDKDETSRPMETTVEVSIPGFAQSAGELIYLNPILLDRFTENPLKLKERSFPVDFGYPSDYNYVLDLKLPEGYTVQEKPGNRQSSIPGGGIQYRRVLQDEGGKLAMNVRFSRTKAVFEPSSYGNLRALYDQMVAAEAEIVVLKKTSGTDL